MNRRHLLGGSTAAACLAQLGCPSRAPSEAADIGLVAIADERTGLPLLRLPEGFRYVSCSWTGEPMADGTPAPPNHDGMGVVAVEDGVATMVRNHEREEAAAFAAPSYDGAVGGGTTTLRFDTRRGQWLSAEPSLAGTMRNCCGGPTPWGTWLSCEETVDGPETNRRIERSHGWVFEVRPGHDAGPPEPLEGLGRFVHEAAAVDPDTGIVYLTEDRGTSGLYRFVPDTYGDLAAPGRLEMLAVAGAPGTDLGRGQRQGASYPTAWVGIADPRRPHHRGQDTLGVFSQGHAAGGAVLRRGEGCWFADGALWVVSTSGGAAGLGQVWRYTPALERIELIAESTGGADSVRSPDNVTVSPHAGLLLCEDSDRLGTLLWFLRADGTLTPFARNNVRLDGERGFSGDFRGGEWAGATFAGDWLFVNVQNPGITFAITGPWTRGRAAQPPRRSA